MALGLDPPHHAARKLVDAVAGTIRPETPPCVDEIGPRPPEAKPVIKTSGRIVDAHFEVYRGPLPAARLIDNIGNDGDSNALTASLRRDLEREQVQRPWWRFGLADAHSADVSPSMLSHQQLAVAELLLAPAVRQLRLAGLHQRFCERRQLFAFDGPYDNVIAAHTAPMIDAALSV